MEIKNYQITLVTLKYINNNKVILKDVLYIQNFKRNIITISKLIEQKYKFVFNINNGKPQTLIYSPKGKRISTIYSNENNNTFQLWLSNNPTTTKQQNQKFMINNIQHLDEDIYLWHRRFGHFNIDRILSTLPKLNYYEKCRICTKSKLRNKPYYPSTNKAKDTFDLIHLDLIGPITESLYGNKYVLTVLDDNSRYNWTFFLKNKSDTFESFRYWTKIIKNQFNKTIKVIRSDNGTEFLSNSFQSFCKDNGIIHQTTVPYNPQQNGRAERLNGVLISTATSLLEDAKLSRRFWEDAMSTASYLYNRIPHQSTNYKVPYEVLFKTKVNYNNIKVFGSKVIFFLPKQLRHKFDNKGSPGIFIGYCLDPYSYKIFDLKNNKVIKCRTVEFFENSPANFYFNNVISEIPDSNTNYENYPTTITFTNEHNHTISDHNNSQHTKYHIPPILNNLNPTTNKTNITSNNKETSINYSSTKRPYNDSPIHIYKNFSNTRVKKMKISEKNQNNPSIREPINYQDIYNL